MISVHIDSLRRLCECLRYSLIHDSCGKMSVEVVCSVEIMQEKWKIVKREIVICEYGIKITE